MVSPNFLIIGVQKCGTTSLHDILKEHPQTNMSEAKEVRFFDLNPNFFKGKEFYKTYFNDPKPEHIATGETSPGYICYPEVPKRIKKVLGKDIKMVLILRDPIKRAYSQYWHSRRKLEIFLSQEEIVDEYLFTKYNPNHRGYFSRGVYINYIKQYLQYFNKTNFHFIIFEDLVQNQERELKSLYKFLGLNDKLGPQSFTKKSNEAIIYKNPFFLFCFKNPEISKYIPKKIRGLFFFGKKEAFKYQLPDKEILDKLKAFYKPYNEELSEFLGKNLDKWM